ncbi:related to Heterogeneous nuclear rnp K-like protein 2 [Saccharomycodes ludwigii]|uniref:Related to Heterogeneous nuclear rnp K-like protein 2 n=1 Tax=Saccharomycodes ludwigii TaxID=36035 RepID=A0A376B787_9ASCO|nr:hypothetical protein SCDLUD_000764 [Saccharomycodes ludwigii]KAH3903151.1 hypothetical protein SCDLUD_000764 [Saccharomycodes ludwigii]SSD60512.1 related to Heterogeneous nuclear rnp K-like protein 2 [Saccharomycodes ludwigii]
MEENQEQQQQQQTKILITNRVLLSIKEASSLIGKGGNTIENIRQEHNVKLSLSPQIPRCSDRVLTCGGDLVDVCNAIADCVAVLNREIPFNERYVNHSYKVLNFILPKPTIDELGDEELLEEGELHDNAMKSESTKAEEEYLFSIGNLRLILSDSEIAVIIGTQGKRIKNLISTYGVKIVASKKELYESDDRILEFQGHPASIAKCLIEVNETLIASFAHIKHGRQYYPHTTFKEVFNVPKEYVGALMGYKGNRIVNLRKFAKCSIKVSEKVDNNGSRSFTITSDHKSGVEKALRLLQNNYKEEIRKRESGYYTNNNARDKNKNNKNNNNNNSIDDNNNNNDNSSSSNSSNTNNVNNNNNSTNAIHDNDDSDTDGSEEKRSKNNDNKDHQESYSNHLDKTIY